MHVVATGLRFPEGPVAMRDGSILLVEIEKATVSRVAPDGTISVVAQTGGGPNGAALGPDGALYVCNNGGFGWETVHGLLKPSRQATFSHGYIQRVDLETGKVRTLYDSCNGNPLAGPNDIVFDEHGGFYFTDLGKNNGRIRHLGGIYYATPDGRRIVEIAHPVTTPNGIGLSPDNRTLYFAESEGARIWAYDIAGPGEVRKLPFPSPNGARLVGGLSGANRFDSLGIDSAGNICVATLVAGCITVISPNGEMLNQISTGDHFTTNICFAGAGRKTAYVTLGGTGKLVALEWPIPGLELNFNPLDP